ncbi:MAG TPA: hypothetical protein VJB61_03260 [Actinomycetota bacterium]
MSAPNLDRSSGSPGSASGRRGRRPLGLLVAACLVVAGAAVGTTVALAGRSSSPAVAAGSGSVVTTQPAARPTGGGQAKAGGGSQVTVSGQAKADRQAKAGGQAGGRDDAGSADTAKGSAVLPDGVHHTLIRKVDIAHDRITVDVVQLFLDGDAVKAAIADGKPREQAEAMTVWLRNRNPRLRTLPLADDLKVNFYQSCDEQPDRRAVLEQLADNVRLGVYFHTLTVRGGEVHAIKERQIQPAC